MDRLLAGEESEAAAIENALLLAVRAAEIKDGVETLLDLFLLFFKEAMTAAAGHSSQLPERQYLAPFLARARERWNLERISDNIQAVEFARQALARNCNRQMVCEVLFLRLLAGEQARSAAW